MSNKNSYINFRVIEKQVDSLDDINLVSILQQFSDIENNISIGEVVFLKLIFGENSKFYLIYKNKFNKVEEFAIYKNNYLDINPTLTVTNEIVEDYLLDYDFYTEKNRFNDITFSRISSYSIPLNDSIFNNRLMEIIMGIMPRVIRPNIMDEDIIAIIDRYNRFPEDLEDLDTNFKVGFTGSLLTYLDTNDLVYIHDKLHTFSNSEDHKTSLPWKMLYTDNSGILKEFNSYGNGSNYYCLAIENNVLTWKFLNSYPSEHLFTDETYHTNLSNKFFTSNSLGNIVNNNLVSSSTIQSYISSQNNSVTYLAIDNIYKMGLNIPVQSMKIRNNWYGGDIKGDLNRFYLELTNNEIAEYQFINYCTGTPYLVINYAVELVSASATFNFSARIKSLNNGASIEDFSDLKNNRSQTASIFLNTLNNGQIKTRTFSFNEVAFIEGSLCKLELSVNGFPSSLDKLKITSIYLSFFPSNKIATTPEETDPTPPAKTYPVEPSKIYYGVGGNIEDGSIKSSYYSDPFLYIGGSFQKINNTSIKNLARINTISNTLDGWDPLANGEVIRILENSNFIYICGNFTSIYDLERINIAKFDKSTLELEDVILDKTIPELSSFFPFDICIFNNYLYICGLKLDDVDPSITNGKIIRYDLSTFEYDSSFILETTHTGDASNINKMEIFNGKLYFIGDFNFVNAVAYSYIARLNSNGTIDSTWKPIIPSITLPDAVNIRTLHASADYLYISGLFETVNGTAKNLARFNTSGVLDSFDVSSIEEFGAIYELGSFVYISTIESPYSGLTRCSKTTGIIDSSWDIEVYADDFIGGGFQPYAPTYIKYHASTQSGNILLVSGNMQKVGGSTLPLWADGPDEFWTNSSIYWKEADINNTTAFKILASSVT
jgi:hypothetical protein